MATWTLKQAKDHLSEILDRVLAGESQEIVRRGDRPVLLIAKDAVVPRNRGAVLGVLTKYADLEFEIPAARQSHRGAADV